MHSDSRTLIGAILVMGVASLAFPAASAQEVEPLYIELEKLLASDGRGSDYFGEYLSIDGDTLVVGRGNIGFHRAHVFERHQGGSNAWGEVAILLAPDDPENFGRAVEVDGDRIAVGATDEEQSGSVYLFERDAGGPGNWGLTGKLQAPGGPVDGQSFNTPAIDGDTLVVGAQGDEEGGGYATGAVFVYERDETRPEGWRFVQKIIPSETDENAKFGAIVDIDDTTFVVGARTQDVGDEYQAGSAYVLEKQGDIWVEARRLTAPVPEGGGHFGEGVAVAGDLVAVGQPDENGNRGAVYLYRRDLGGPGEWGLEARLSHPEGNLFGLSVDLDGEVLVVGDYLWDVPEVPNAGAIHVFERRGVAGWVELARLEASDPAEGQHFGEEVGIGRGTLVVGAPLDDEAGDRAGAVYVIQTVAHPEISVTGTCPGQVTLTLTGATSGGGVLVAKSATEGMAPLPEPCGGGELGLEDPSLLLAFLADEEGAESHVRTVPEEACGLLLQAVDRVTCGVGEVRQVP